MIYDTPQIYYGFVRNVTKEDKVIPAAWYGIVCIPGRVIGLNVMLECGATYRNIPPWDFSFDEYTKNNLYPSWDCYWRECKIHKYQYLSMLSCALLDENKQIFTPYIGEYLFSVKPYNDIFSPTPEQDKEYYFIKIENNLTYAPNNEVLFVDKSFTEKDLSIIHQIKRQKDCNSVE